MDCQPNAFLVCRTIEFLFLFNCISLFFLKHFTFFFNKHPHRTGTEQKIPQKRTVINLNRRKQNCHKSRRSKQGWITAFRFIFQENIKHFCNGVIKFTTTLTGSLLTRTIYRHFIHIDVFKQSFR